MLVRRAPFTKLAFLNQAQELLVRLLHQLEHRLDPVEVRIVGQVDKELYLQLRANFSEKLRLGDSEVDDKDTNPAASFG